MVQGSPAPLPPTYSNRLERRSGSVIARAPLAMLRLRQQLWPGQWPAQRQEVFCPHGQVADPTIGRMLATHAAAASFRGDWSTWEEVGAGLPGPSTSPISRPLSRWTDVKRSRSFSWVSTSRAARSAAASLSSWCWRLTSFAMPPLLFAFDLREAATIDRIVPFQPMVQSLVAFHSA